MSPQYANSQPVTVDPQMLLQMQETIRQQQEQLKLQAEQIRQQLQKLDAMQQQINSIHNSTPTSLTQKESTSPAKTAERSVNTAPPVSVKPGNENVKLSISGQVNRAVMTANDGYNNTVYHVDNNVSNSRVRFVAKARANEDLTIGSRVEVAIAGDLSSQVSQNLRTSGDYFDQRWIEIYFDSRTFGKISIGKGDTASNTTSEVDLSKTDVVQYSSISDMGGGLLFREKNASHSLTTLKVSDNFKNFDGLSRLSRLRYDSPGLMGFRLAGSLATNQRSDAALYWGGQGYGFQGAGAFAVANPKLANTGLQYNGSFSLLHTNSGLNLTLSGGLQSRTGQKDSTNLYAKAGWIANFTSLGYTAFGVDYTNSQDIAASGNRGYSVGSAVVQAFEKVGTELYLQYRIFSLDRASGQPVGDINMTTFGARVKF